MKHQVSLPESPYLLMQPSKSVLQICKGRKCEIAEISGGPKVDEDEGVEMRVVAHNVWCYDNQSLIAHYLP